jgi:hypothetical protein
MNIYIFQHDETLDIVEVRAFSHRGALERLPDLGAEFTLIYVTGL